MRNKLISLLLSAAFVPVLAHAQLSGALQFVNQTSLSTSMSYNALAVNLSANFTAASPLGAVAVANGVNLPNLFNAGNVGSAVGSFLYIVDPGSLKGEAVQVVSLVATGRYNVKRGVAGTAQTAHVSGAMVLVGPPNAFRGYDPQGGCAVTSDGYGPTGQQYSNLTVNLASGYQWICSSVTNSWVPGWNNPNAPAVSTAVASAAGLVTPSGPMFHVTGALAITGFNIPLGFSGGQFVILPDGAFTTTNANNIAIASTGVVSKALTYSYDVNAAKPFFPSY